MYTGYHDSTKRRTWRKLSVPVAVLGVVTLTACGTSAGGFSTTPVSLCGQSKAQGILAADFNGDGADDLAVGCRTRHHPIKGRVEIWLSDGSGAFERVQSLSLGSLKSGGEGAGPITAADFNEDGRPDLLITDSQGIHHGVSVLYGRNDGKFGPPKYYHRELSWLATSDVNGDGHMDMIPVNYGSTRRVYVAGTGGRIDASLRGRVLARDTRDYKEPNRVDINGDGRADAVFRTPHSGKLEVYPSGGKHFTLRVGKDVRRIRRVFAGGEFDGDGMPDLVVATPGKGGHRTLRLLLSQGGEHLSAPIPAAEDAAQVTVGDFNGDGAPDLLVKPPYGDDGPQATVLLRRSKGGFKKVNSLALPKSSNGWVVGDFNGDGKSDFLYRRITDEEDQGIVYLSQW